MFGQGALVWGGGGGIILEVCSLDVCLYDERAWRQTTLVLLSKRTPMSYVSWKKKTVLRVSISRGSI